MEEVIRVRLPDRSRREMFGIVTTMLGGGHVKVKCEDGKERLGRIPGKLRKKIWIREGDVVVVVPWSFQDEKCDVIWRYTNPQVEWLERKGYLKF
ncbi:MAG: translation initiation factor eIF-1A [Archaeoglobales archaeon]|nr:MAG: translation initiation factor eIF-1A [Archaeoglobales archaeon]